MVNSGARASRCKRQQQRAPRDKKQASRRGGRLSLSLFLSPANRYRAGRLQQQQQQPPRPCSSETGRQQLITSACAAFFTGAARGGGRETVSSPRVLCLKFFFFFFLVLLIRGTFCVGAVLMGKSRRCPGHVWCGQNGEDDGTTKNV